MAVADQSLIKEVSPALWDDLTSLDPELVALRSGAEVSSGGYSLDFLGKNHWVNPSTRQIHLTNGELIRDFQKNLVLLVYLATCANGPDPGLAHRQVSPWEIKGGSMFFRGPHALNTAPVAEKFGQDPPALTKLALSLGGRVAPPATFAWMVLPRLEICGYLEPEDDEFPADYRYTFDAHAHYYLPLDALWGLVDLVTCALTSPQ